MLTALRQGRVDSLKVAVTVARSLEDAPHDVYLVDVAIEQQETGGGRFDEVPYLESLEPVLEAAGRPSTWTVDIARTHRSDRNGVGQAHLSVQLATGRAPSAVGPDLDLTEAVRAAFGQLVPGAGPGAGQGAGALSRDEALAAAHDAVTNAFPDIDAAALSLTEEENHAAEGRWTLGLMLAGATRFQVHLGLVHGHSLSAHVRRLQASEVVDSVGP